MRPGSGCKKETRDNQIVMVCKKCQCIDKYYTKNINEQESKKDDPPIEIKEQEPKAVDPPIDVIEQSPDQSLDCNHKYITIKECKIKTY